MDGQATEKDDKHWVVTQCYYSSGFIGFYIAQYDALDSCSLTPDERDNTCSSTNHSHTPESNVGADVELSSRHAVVDLLVASLNTLLLLDDVVSVVENCVEHGNQETKGTVGWWWWWW
jgi:hypothetical protein